jgi:CheY-like chemotaxis protein
MPDKKKRVLIVDDDASVRDVLSRHLGVRGFETVCVGDAPGAFEKIASDVFDAILLDNSLPGMMGITALPRIVEMTKAPVILITGYPNEETYKDALLLGAKAFMAKPIDPDELAAQINGIIAK